MKNSALKSGANLLKALANEKRLEIIYNLINKELNVSDLGKVVELSQSSLSQHLAILRVEKIVKTRKVAQTVFYSIQSDNAVKILMLLDKIYSRSYKSVNGD